MNGSNGTWRWIATTLAAVLVTALGMWGTLGVNCASESDLQMHVNDSTVHERDDAKRRRIREELELAIKPLRDDIREIKAALKP